MSKTNSSVCSSSPPISQNAIITGLRGVGKTVLLDDLKPIAQAADWLGTGNDLSELTSLTAERISMRIVVDLAALLGPLMTMTGGAKIGFTPAANAQPLEHKDLWKLYEATPGLAEDKLKAVLVTVAQVLAGSGKKGIVFAYDEAQNFSDHAAKGEFPSFAPCLMFSQVFNDQVVRFSFCWSYPAFPRSFPS